MREMLTGKKQKDQKEDMKLRKINLAEVEVFIDNELTHFNIYSDKNPVEQSLIYDIRRIQQLLSEKEVSKVHLVDTKHQMADVMTKEMRPTDEFLKAMYGGMMSLSCRCCYRGCVTGLVDIELGYKTGLGFSLAASEDRGAQGWKTESRGILEIGDREQGEAC